MVEVVDSVVVGFDVELDTEGADKVVGSAEFVVEIFVHEAKNMSIKNVKSKTNRFMLFSCNSRLFNSLDKRFLANEIDDEQRNHRNGGCGHFIRFN